MISVKNLCSLLGVSPAEIPSEMPPMTTTEEHERQKLEEYCANAAYFPSWDAEGKCDDLKKLKDPEK